MTSFCMEKDRLLSKSLSIIFLGLTWPQRGSVRHLHSHQKAIKSKVSRITWKNMAEWSRWYHIKQLVWGEMAFNPLECANRITLSISVFIGSAKENIALFQLGWTTINKIQTTAINFNTIITSLITYLCEEIK